MASTAAVCNVTSENLLGNGLKLLSGFVTFADAYDQASNPLMNMANYLATADIPMVMIAPSAAFCFRHNGGTVAAGTVAAICTGNGNSVTGTAFSQVANGTTVAATVPFIVIAKTN